VHSTTLPAYLTTTRIAIVVFMIGLSFEAVPAVSTAVNYSQFYHSLTSLQLRITSFTLTPETNITDVSAVFSLANPTDYQGLKLNGVDASYTLQSGNRTLRSTTTMNAPYMQSQSLNPSQPVRIPFAFTSNYTDQNLFRFRVAVAPSTVIDKQGWVQVIYFCDPGESLDCQLTSLSFIAVGHAGPSPGPQNCQEPICGPWNIHPRGFLERTDRLEQRRLNVMDSENLRTVLGTTLWMIAVISVYVQALFAHGGVTITDFAIVSLFSLGAGVIIRDPRKTLMAFIATMVLSTLGLLYIALNPITNGGLNLFAVSWLQTLWVTVLFEAIFPIPLIMYLGSALLGTLIGDRLTD
jgi:hypothetical protein